MKSFSKRRLGRPFCEHLPHLADAGLCELGGRAGFALSRDGSNNHPEIVSVSEVLGRSYVLQIRQLIICFISVLVVNVHTLRARAEKGSGDQFVNHNGPLRSLWSVKGYTRIAVSIKATCSISRRQMSIVLSSGAFYAAMIGNKIAAFVSGYVAPFFGFAFFSGKVLNNQDRNLHRLGFVLARLVRLRKQTCEPLAILT